MQSFKPLGVSQVLSSSQFIQLQELLAETASADAKVLTQRSPEVARLLYQEPTFEWLGLRVDQFMGVVSADFSALLVGEQVVQGYRIGLTFEPEAIALFLSQSQQFPIAVQPNNPHAQSEFTLKLINLLTTNSLASEHAGTIAMQQQIQRVTTQIRQSLELPVILQTAVEQGRQFLNADRLIIYQLGHANDASPESGFVAYEAKASDEISSVLHLIDACDVLQSSRHSVLYCQGSALAVEDVNISYATTPCLLHFLQTAQVRSKLIAPIFQNQALWGFLVAHECHHTRQWQESERQFLQQIAEHLAIAISQAQLYAEVQQQKQTLEQRVIERTQELQAVTQTAQSANRAKSEFLASVTHELRTPLTCIIGMSTTLQRWSKDTLNERQQGFLQIIHDSGEQLLSLINDILDVSQADSHQMTLELGKVSPILLARQTLKAFEAEATLRSIDLKLDLPSKEKVEPFTADPRRVQQILFNLMDNAVKFTSEGGKITLRVSREENQVTFQVKDTGIGIFAAQIPLLFQKFRQLDAGYHRQYRGTGLGLALVKQLVELHGGWVGVESIPEVGSIFTVRLPTSHLGKIKVRIPPMVEQPQGRIVLIEHDEDNATVVCDVLTAAGYQVVWLLEGLTAIDSIEALRPFMVITNARLSDIDGASLVQGLRQNLAMSRVKVVVMVDEAEIGARIDWLAIGADDWLFQPVRPDILLQKILLLV
ncbi:MAG: GAF domain-containing protein [Timaviella obliquedivisa GSE-PSE-MK23-08B]|nr:GAF domain-containing protein [Timaviella obliquedivisa GSE-PSE-MK23-08B]